MEIAIVGAGNVGGALGKGWRKAGHQVGYALRDTAGTKVDELRRGGFDVLAITDAGKADVIVLAVPWPNLSDAVKRLGRVDGKIIVDATNPLTAEMELALGFTDSAAETVARLAPGAHVVKAFNVTGSDNMALAHAFKTKPLMPVASDDEQAKTKVMKLAEDLGFEALDAGPLKTARLLEPMAIFWIKQAYVQNQGREFAFALARR
ncbi:MAG: NAD(P)-binding domain-containing protein [Hyphomicrobiales bacterium]|nr:NAD(P)-binding domain-containing protein [Hyphomicrobiales bacterium]